MNEENKLSLQGILMKFAEDGPRDMFTKQNVLLFAKNDIEAVKEAFSEWESAGAVRCLAEIETALPETMVVKIDLKKLTKIYQDNCVKKGVAIYRNMNPEEKVEFLRRLDGPKLRNEILHCLDPEERAQALKCLDPALLVDASAKAPLKINLW